MTSKTPVRSAEDIDEQALSYGEIKALATGNPKILEKTELDSKVAKLKILRQSHLNQKYDLETKIVNYYPKEITAKEYRIQRCEIDIEHLKNNTIPNADGFSKMIISGIEYTEKEQAGKALLEVCKNKKKPEQEEIGEYRGFRLELGFDTVQRAFTMTLKNKNNYSIYLGDDVFGNIKRIDNELEGINDYLNSDKLLLEDLKVQLENAKHEATKEFPQEQELNELIEKLDELNIELSLNEKEKQVVDTGTDEIENESQECDKDKIR